MNDNTDTASEPILRAFTEFAFCEAVSGLEYLDQEYNSIYVPMRFAEAFAI